ncbi:hypothetical protein GCK32_018994, partial [Trichostrongylus colubriformis]
VTEELELEVRADSVQPARLILPITIIPSDAEVQEQSEKKKSADGKRKQSQFPRSRLVPAGDQLPVIVLVLVLFVTVFVLLCRRKRSKPKLESPQEPLSPASKTSLQEKPDLLGSTVFASVGQSDMSPRQPLRTFERPQVTPLNKRRHQPSLDYAGLATDTPPPMPLFKQLTAQRSDAQHWV